jgi:hypothetical protein
MPLKLYYLPYRYQLVKHVYIFVYKQMMKTLFKLHLSKEMISHFNNKHRGEGTQFIFL